VLDKFTRMDPALHRYAVAHCSGLDELLLELAAETERAAGEMSIMLTAPEQAAMMTVLVRATGVRRALELGTFTGYGSIAIARGLAAGGNLLTCDVNEEWSAIARRYWSRAGLEDRIELRLGPALETLESLPRAEPFDFAFIDADKPNYPAYYEHCVELVRPGGMIVVDNVFAGGAVTGEAGDGMSEESVQAIRETNDRVAGDDRVLSAMIGVSDGITLALRS
jgi:caffeoyl-CoA O-methyltransferase